MSLEPWPGRPLVALTAGLCSCSESFGYVRDNGLAGIVGHSPEDDPLPPQAEWLRHRYMQRVSAVTG